MSGTSRFATIRLLVMGIFEIPSVWIWSIQSLRTGRCDSLRNVMYTSRPVALCRCWICDSSAMYYPLRWWACGTHTVAINDLVGFCLSFAYLCLSHVCQRHLWGFKLFFPVSKILHALVMIILQIAIYFGYFTGYFAFLKLLWILCSLCI